MRLLGLGLIAVLLLAVVFTLFVFQGKEAVHIASLFPEDFHFGLVYSSVDNLRGLYEGPHARRDLDPARPRIGERVNVPELDGVAYRAPVGSYFSADDEEVLLVPYRDFAAFEQAFDTARENLRLKSPRRVSANYLSLSASAGGASRGRDLPLILRAAEYPAALVGRPRDAAGVRTMLTYLLMFEGARERVSAPLLAQQVARLPDGICDAVAFLCEELLLGIDKGEVPEVGARVTVDGKPPAGGALERAAEVAGRIELTDLVRGLPREAVLFAGAVLDAEGWQSLGLPAPLGDGAFLLAIMDANAAFSASPPGGRRIQARPYSLLLLARPAESAALERLDRWAAGLFLGGGAFEGDAEVRTAPLEKGPAWLSHLLRSSAREAPEVEVAVAADGGVWICHVGARAQEVVSVALGCLRGAEELSVAGREVGRASPKPIRAHRGFLGGGHLAVAHVSAAGMKALGRPVPYVQIASVGQPSAVTFALDGGERIAGEIWLHR